MNVYKLNDDVDKAGLFGPVDEEEFGWSRQFDGRPFGSARRPLRPLRPLAWSDDQPARV